MPQQQQHQPYSEPWDELMGPPPVSSLSASSAAAVVSEDQVDKFLRGEVDVSSTMDGSGSHRSSSKPTSPTPPPYAFSRSGSANGGRNSNAGGGGGFGQMPERWARHAPTTEDTQMATHRAMVSLGSDTATTADMSSSASVSSSNGGSVSFQASGAARRRSNLPIEGDYPDRVYQNNDGGAYQSDEDYDDDEASFGYPTKADPPEVLSSKLLPSSNSSRDDDAYDGPYSSVDAGQIRQDALKVLQLADTSSSTYSVHRTVTGGFMASAQPFATQKKRLPTALSGLSFQAAGRNSRTIPTSTAKPYRDYVDPTEDVMSYHDQPPVAMPKSAPPPPPLPGDQDDHEYVDSHVLDYIHGKAGRNNSQSNGSSGNNWSSRYSVDNTLLALSGGATPNANRKYLDKLDQSHSTGRGAAGFFGSGAFQFRKPNAAAAVSSPQTNLRTVWIDVEPHHQDGDGDDDTGADRSAVAVGERKKSWQEQVMIRKRQRRACMLIVGAILIFCITIGTLARKRSQNQPFSAAAASLVGTSGGMIFYATANVPMTSGQDSSLADKISKIDPSAKFLIHLGNIQDPQVTQCNMSAYTKVSDILSASPVPVFIVPGKDDVNNCPDPTMAWANWYRNFVVFDTQFPHDFEVARQINHLENFAFEVDNILYLGLHLDGGNMTSAEALLNTDLEDMSWIQSMIEDHANVTSIVLFGNAGPGDESNIDFFRAMTSYLDTVGIPAMYMHAAEETMLTGQAKSYWVGNLYTVQVANGGVDPLQQVAVVPTGTKPFSIF